MCNQICKYQTYCLLRDFDSRSSDIRRVPNVPEGIEAVDFCQEYGLLICGKGQRMMVLKAHEESPGEVRNLGSDRLVKVTIGHNVNLALTQHGTVTSFLGI